MFADEAENRGDEAEADDEDASGSGDDEDASAGPPEDIEKDPAYSPEDEDLKGIKGG